MNDTLWRLDSVGFLQNVLVLLLFGCLFQQAGPCSGQPLQPWVRSLALAWSWGCLELALNMQARGTARGLGQVYVQNLGLPFSFARFLVLITAAEVALSCVPTCFSSSRWLRLGPALRLKAVIKSLPFSWWLSLLLVTLLCLETVGFCRFNLCQGWSAGTAQAQKRKLQSRT